MFYIFTKQFENFLNVLKFILEILSDVSPEPKFWLRTWLSLKRFTIINNINLLVCKFYLIVLYILLFKYMKVFIFIYNLLLYLIIAVMTELLKFHPRLEFT